MLFLKPIFIIISLVVAIVAIVVLAVQLTGDRVVDLSVEVEWEGNTLTIAGNTTLPDKAVVSFEVGPADEVRLAEEGIYASGITVVKKGQYSVQLNATLFPPADIKIWVRFQLGPHSLVQPPEIVKRYGNRGQRLKGKNLIEEDGYYRIEVSKVVVFPLNL